MKQTKKRVLRDYQEQLLQDLLDPGLALAYLNEALRDEDPRIFLLALHNVLESQGKQMTTIDHKQLNRMLPVLRSFSVGGTSIVALLNAAGYSLAPLR
jgi:hypothetical protein